jgi:predicted AlkP superfamily phosphohydrolase/phosphomutase
MHSMSDGIARTRVLFIGLDACDPILMHRLVATGRAPAVAGLLERGAHAMTSPPFGLFEGALWPSLFTGCDAARHGYYCHEALEVGTYEHRDTSPHEIAEVPFWETLSDHGKQVAVLDVPHSAATRPVNGVQLVEWGAHDRHFGCHSWPDSLADEVQSTFGPHPVGCFDAGSSRGFAPCDWVHRAHGAQRTDDEARRLRADILAGVDRKTELSLHYLDRGGWDVFMTVFGEAHCAGHQFWYLHDHDDPGHDPRLAAEIGDPIEEVYARLDRAVGAHVERAGPETAVFLLLSHGMRRMNSGVFLIDAVLHRLASREPARPHRDGGLPTFGRAWRTFPVKVRHRLAPAVARRVRRHLATDPVGLSAYHDVFDRCPGCSGVIPAADTDLPWFVVPNNTVYGGIRLNVVGREPHGVIEPGAQFDEACEQLAADLLDIVKVESGEPLVRSVSRASAHHERSANDPFPDVFIEWDRRSSAKTVYSPKIGVVHEPYEHWRSGDHLPEGLLISTGPGITPGVRPSVSVTDIAPTMCEYVGVELDEVDGRARPDFLPSRAARSAAVTQ